MEIQQTQQITVQDALKALADYRIAAGFQPVRHSSPEMQALDTDLSGADAVPAEPLLPRVGRYINIMA